MTKYNYSLTHDLPTKARKAFLGPGGFPFMVVGMGAVVAMGVTLAFVPDEDYKMNESVYARRYIHKYRQANIEKAKAEQH